MAQSRTIRSRPGGCGDPRVDAVLRQLNGRLRRRFGDDCVRLILFGSRARGDNAPDSDADVAVVFRNPVEDRWSRKRAIIGETYPLLLETGLYIQCWPISERDLQEPERAFNPGLLRNILREGIAA